MKLINVTGVGNAGKGAVVDLLREYQIVFAPEAKFEFDFFRVYGGMFDFLNTIDSENSSCRTDIALKKIHKLTIQMGINPSRYDLCGNMISTGQRYDGIFDGNFISLTQSFLDSLVWNTYKAYWPYERMEINKIENLIKKIQDKLGLNVLSNSEISLIDNSDLDKKFNSYFNKLFSNLGNEHSEFFIMNNFSEPYNIESMSRWLPKSKSIAVVRDPRDIFISGLSGKQINRKNKHFLPSENDGKSKSFLATNDISIFIERYKRNMNALHDNKSNNQLLVNFEDLIFKYDDTKKDILEFIGISEFEKFDKFKHFAPHKSKKNVQIWKNFHELEQLKKIEEELSEYIYS